MVEPVPSPSLHWPLSFLIRLIGKGASSGIASDISSSIGGSSEIHEKFIESVGIIKELINDNNQLRAQYETSTQEAEQYEV
jgi:putative effector of murein hydrolase